MIQTTDTLKSQKSDSKILKNLFKGNFSDSYSVTEFDSTYTIIGDCLDVLSHMKDHSVNIGITSPPYNLDKNYGKYNDDKPLEEWEALIENVAKQMHRVLKPNGTLILELPDILENCKQFEQADFQKRYELLNVIYGGVTPEYPHRWGWWDEELISHLLHAGFSSAKRGELVFVGHWGYNMRIEAIK